MNKPEKLPEAELDIMLCLWRHTQPVRTSQILSEVSAKHSWTLSTLKVLLGRLADKGCIEVTRDGRFTLYSAVLQQKDYSRREVKSVLEKYFDNSAKSMVAALVSEHKLSQKDIEELEAILRNGG